MSLQYLKLPPGRDLRSNEMPYARTGLWVLLSPWRWDHYWEDRWLTAQAWMKVRGIKRLVISPWSRMQRIPWDSGADYDHRYWNNETRGL